MEKNGNSAVTKFENHLSIQIEEVNFDYLRVRTGSIKNLFSSLVKGFYLEKNVLKQISIKIEKGETIGLIGGNGSGKSTLLRLIAGIYTPSKGRVRTRGIVSPLMDLGAGFHPEMSTADNILLNGTLLGIPNINVQAIAEWANLSDKLNDPVRTFSSGMLARLSFSIATSVTPDILLIDEVLSVGDRNFQEKSLKRMHELIKSDSTVVMVTHNLELIEKECNRVIWIENGKLVSIDSPARILKQYNKRAIK